MKMEKSIEKNPAGTEVVMGLFSLYLVTILILHSLHVSQ